MEIEFFAMFIFLFITHEFYLSFFIFIFSFSRFFYIYFRYMRFFSVSYENTVAKKYIKHFTHTHTHSCISRTIFQLIFLFYSIRKKEPLIFYEESAEVNLTLFYTNLLFYFLYKRSNPCVHSNFVDACSVHINMFLRSISKIDDYKMVSFHSRK
jgi:hypothetical protein